MAVTKLGLFEIEILQLNCDMAREKTKEKRGFVISHLKGAREEADGCKEYSFYSVYSVK